MQTQILVPLCLRIWSKCFFDIQRLIEHHSGTKLMRASSREKTSLVDMNEVHLSKLGPKL